jgi:protein-tyrosine-phosphatase
MTRIPTLMIAAAALLSIGCGQTGPGGEPAETASKESTVHAGKTALYPELETQIAAAAAETDRIPEERRLLLDRLAGYVSARRKAGEPSRLTFICTHNSRRSHMSQIWAQAAAAYYGVPAVHTYSGGTEATAFNPRAVAALERAGFRIERGPEADNPVHRVRFADDSEAMEAFSKVYDRPPNPTSDFCAVMTCAEADASCPMVLGAADRIAIPYEDPKAFDGTDRETEEYDERCRQIAREMLYLFSQVELS